MRWKKKYRVKKSKDKIQGYQIHEQRIIDTFLLFPTTALCDFTEVRWLERVSILRWYNGKGRWGNLAWIDGNKASALKSVDNYNKQMIKLQFVKMNRIDKRIYKEVITINITEIKVWTNALKGDELISHYLEEIKNFHMNFEYKIISSGYDNCKKMNTYKILINDANGDTITWLHNSLKSYEYIRNIVMINENTKDENRRWISC